MPSFTQKKGDPFPNTTLTLLYLWLFLNKVVMLDYSKNFESVTDYFFEPNRIPNNSVVTESKFDLSF